MVPQLQVLAAANNLTGEFMLTHLLKHVLPLVGERDAGIIQREIIVHEGNHIHNGRMILERHAKDPEIQRQVESTVNEYFDFYCNNYQSPYAEFIGPEFFENVR